MNFKNNLSYFGTFGFAAVGSFLALLSGMGIFRFSEAIGGSTENPPGLSSRGLFKTKSAPKVFPKTELASFAAGCFWGVEQEFRNQKGVLATAVGFMGGHTKNPTYRQVSYENTNHAETVQLEYDPKVVSYHELLDLFWHLHDPTTKNRQGPDVGSQYRSAIFYHTPQQKEAAEASKKALEKSGELDDLEKHKSSKSGIVTEITPASEFTKAEDYHQQYVEKGGAAGCHIRRPKL